MTSVNGGETPGLPAGWRGLGLAAMLGGAAALGQAPIGLWPITLVGLAFFLRSATTSNRKRGFAVAWAFGVGYFAVSLHWIIQPFLVDAARHGWMAPFALFFMAAGMALFWGAAGAVVARQSRPLVPLALAIAIAEATRSHVLTGFPWALLGHVWIDTPLAQIAALSGPHGLTILTLGLATALAAGGARAVSLAPLLAIGGLWVALDPGKPDTPGSDAPLVRIIQPNAAQDQKWQPGMARQFFDRQLDLTRGDPALPAPDLIVWPETSVPWLLEQADPALDEVALASGGAPVVLGIQRREGRRYFNSLAVLGPDGEVTDLYDKHHIVPFGEYIPLGELAARFGLRGLAASEGGGYSRGPGPRLVGLPGLGLALPLICYEGIFAEEVNDAPQRPDLLILITNDAWFGDWAGPAQHLAQARLRAIEQGLPLVRSANTGISAMIDARGRIVSELALNIDGSIDAALPPARPPTIYSRMGDELALVLLMTLAVALFARAGRK